jgi:hypothetical protein
VRGRSTILALLVAAITVAGCEPTGPAGRSFDGVFPPTRLVNQLPVRVVDTTGLVLAVATADDIGAPEGVSTVSDQPDAIAVAWLGGACDDRVDIAFEGAVGAIALTVQTARSGTCRLIGIERVIVLHLTEAIDPSSVSLTVLP